MVRLWSAAAVAALSAATAASLAACAAPQARTQRSTSSHSASAPSAVPTIGLLPASPKLTTRLALDRTTAAAGTAIEGTLIVTYRGSQPLNLTKTCRPDFAVVLTNSKFPPDVAFPMLCSRLPFTINPGENRLPFTLDTGYRSCSQTGQSSDGMPKCLQPPTIMPPLPAGNYQAVLVGNGLALPPPQPVAVTLTAPRSG